ncbi:MAG: alpha/beta fold hydrolase [Candidatus Nanopelagicales bacterium]
MLLFIPGFMTPPRAYSTLLGPLQQAGASVEMANGHSLTALTGNYSPAQEASDVLKLVDRLSHRQPVWLAGHSRGGQVAWRAANLAPDRVAGLFLIDPVDGAGREGGGPRAAAEPVRFGCPATIVGAGRGGRCAPSAVNHQTFAAALPAAHHVVIADLGHADVLDGWQRTAGRWLCGGADDPDQVRGDVAALLVAAVARPPAPS